MQIMKLKKRLWHGCLVHFIRAIFVWPWNENAPTKQKQQTNGNRAIWLPANFLEINHLRFDVILQHDWPIEQCLLIIRIFFGGKTKRPCFDLFLHWFIKQTASTYRHHFSYENRSNAINYASSWAMELVGLKRNNDYYSLLPFIQQSSNVHQPVNNCLWLGDKELCVPTKIILGI